MSDHTLSRRDLLALLGLGALGTRIPLGPLSDITPIALRDVRPLDGPFLDAQRRDARYLLSLDPDRLLANFRTNAGLTPKAPVYGGWESEEPWVAIRCHGHTLGHWLGAIAMMYAATGDDVCRERAAYTVRELRACQQARGDGLVCAFPDGAKPLEDAIAGRPWNGVPWYTQHKIMAGLRDAHVHAAVPNALDVLVGLCDWTVRATRDMRDDAMQRMLDTEHGGMTEVLADAYALTGNAEYLALARRFAHRAVLDPFASGRDVLNGLHANTQIPKFVGYQRVYALTGDAAFGAAAREFWNAVALRRSFATGGHGDNEHFFPVADVAKHLASAKTMETCGTHNMLRLTRALFDASPSSAYMDWYERALYNGILASQDPTTGMMTYFQATRPGYVRLYHTTERSFWCCTGTGMENHAAYGHAIYSAHGDALYVNLFIASRLDWRERGLTVTQTTRFPDADTTRLTIGAARATRAELRVRRPAWCEGMRVTVNGRAIAATPDADGYVRIARTWRDGDTIDARLPMSLRVEPLAHAPAYVAFAYGPIVLAGALGTEGVTPEAQLIVNERESGSMLNAAIEVPTLAANADDLLRRVRAVPNESLAFETVGLGRPRDVRLVPFHRLAHERYNLYWKTGA